MTIGEQHLSIYEVLIHKLEQFMEALDILSTGHLSINLISHTQLPQTKTVLQKTNPDNTILFHYLYYYYDMKLISFGYDKDFNPSLQFPAFTEPYT